MYVYVYYEAIVKLLERQISGDKNLCPTHHNYTRHDSLTHTHTHAQCVCFMQAHIFVLECLCMSQSFSLQTFRGQMALMAHEPMRVCDCVSVSRAYSIAYIEGEGPLSETFRSLKRQNRKKKLRGQEGNVQSLCNPTAAWLHGHSAAEF